MPGVSEALLRLDRELSSARQQQVRFLKVIHGYGSSGIGGDIRVAVQARLCEMADAGLIHGCIFGENWAKSDETTWKLLHIHEELKHDPDMGRRNLGITIVVL
ncbi:MAG TPA: Smr/MutS family protein [Verrucomicrobiae bacterium]|nr:Smr/MutS family protein [Verrucomicrobiae bacterium]